MPFLVSRVNVAVSDEQELELKRRLGRSIAHVPGKGEGGLMLVFEGDSRMWLAGERDVPMAYVEAAVFANEDGAGYEELSADIAQAFHEVLGIPARRVYMRYSDIPIWSIGEMVVD